MFQKFLELLINNKMYKNYCQCALDVEERKKKTFVQYYFDCSDNIRLID